jgi:hypothetical protein
MIPHSREGSLIVCQEVDPTCDDKCHRRYKRNVARGAAASRTFECAGQRPGVSYAVHSRVVFAWLECAFANATTRWTFGNV